MIKHDSEFHHILKSPCTYHQLNGKYKRQANFLTQTFHGLDFNADGIEIREFVRLTLEHVQHKMCITKGEEKLKWITNMYRPYTNTVVYTNIDSCPAELTFSNAKLCDISEICPYHGRISSEMSCHCALSQARQLRDFFQNIVNE